MTDRVDGGLSLIGMYSSGGRIETGIIRGEGVVVGETSNLT